MGLVKVKPDGPYIHQCLIKTNEYKFIFIGFETDEFKNSDEWMMFSYSGCPKFSTQTIVREINKLHQGKIASGLS
jgi:hypothetical protein